MSEQKNGLKNGRGFKISGGVFAVILLLIIQLTLFSFGYGQLTQQVRFNRELIQSYQGQQNLMEEKLDQLRSEIRDKK